MANPFNTDQNVRETYFIDESEKDTTTPANDVGKVPQLESDGMLSHLFVDLSPSITDGTSKSITTDGNTAVLCIVSCKVQNGGSTSDTATLKYDGIVKHSVFLQGDGLSSGMQRNVSLMFLEVLPAKTANITVEGVTGTPKILVIKLGS